MQRKLGKITLDVIGAYKITLNIVG